MVEAVKIVLEVLRDGQRNDRYLRVAADGTYYTSPDKTFISDDGPYTPTYVLIPVAYDCTEEEEDRWAASLVDELDAK